jgi:hypothetical protein
MGTRLRWRRLPPTPCKCRRKTSTLCEPRRLPHLPILSAGHAARRSRRRSASRDRGRPPRAFRRAASDRAGLDPHVSRHRRSGCSVRRSQDCLRRGAHVEEALGDGMGPGIGVRCRKSRIAMAAPTASRRAREVPTIWPTCRCEVGGARVTQSPVPLSPAPRRPRPLRKGMDASWPQISYE